MTASRDLAFGFSSCPNDTFMVHALVFGGVEVIDPSTDEPIELRPVIEDIEALNLRALDPTRRAPLTKISASALAYAVDHYTVLDAGAALGRGCGPLVVRRSDRNELGELRSLAGKRVAIPGEKTTAYLLLRVALAARDPSLAFTPVPMRFDRIMPAVAEGQVDAGLIIHESRFTYSSHGLVELADLGNEWESLTGLPIPLGVIVAARELGEPMIAALERGLRASVEQAFAAPERPLPWIRELAQELDDEVCRRHIELYVNQFSRSLGTEGRAAIDELLRRGRASGLLPPGRSPWR